MYAPLPPFGPYKKCIRFIYNMGSKLISFFYKNELFYPLFVLFQGPDPRPLWLLVRTPSDFGPELACRLRVAQPTLVDVPIFLIYFYITIYVCVPHFYDLSAFVGCWSSVSIRRIIYKFLNVRPFDCTAVAVSGKVERSLTGLTTPVGWLLLLQLTVLSRSAIVV